MKWLIVVAINPKNRGTLNQMLLAFEENKSLPIDIEFMIEAGANKPTMFIPTKWDNVSLDRSGYNGEDEFYIFLSLLMVRRAIS